MFNKMYYPLYCTENTQLFETDLVESALLFNKTILLKKPK